MKFTSIIAIYFLFFAGSAFILLPFGVKTTEDRRRTRLPGQAESAPHQFDISRHLMKAAILGAILFAIYYANWTYGWITTDELDFYNPPQSQSPRLAALVDRVRECGIELAGVGRHQSDRNNSALTLRHDPPQHRFEIVDVTVH